MRSLLLMLLLPLACGATATKPNVILFYVDDLGWGGVGSYGGRSADTPHIDRLTASGLKFTQAYAAAPNCSPSRASLLTGLYPTRHGITMALLADRVAPRGRLLDTPSLPPGLDPRFVTLAEVLKDAGYTTASIGKWHLGGPGFLPEDHGFDLNVGGSAHGLHQSVFPPYIKGVFTGREGEHITERLARSARQFLEDNRRNPFFLYLPFYSIHNPLGGTHALDQKYLRRNPAGYRYQSMTEAMDRAVGSVLTKLDELGLSDQTLIILSSDNGAMSHDACGGLRGRKGDIYEGGIRVPLVISGFGVQNPGRRIDEPVHQIDLMPTILALLGIPCPPVDGISLEPVIHSGRNQGAIPPREIFFHYPHYSRKGTYARPASAIRAGDYKLIRLYEEDRYELYNLAQDPSESHDLISIDPKRATGLKADLNAWLQETKAKLPHKH